MAQQAVKSDVIAAIDVGTNSFHMVIATVTNRGVLKALSRQNEMVRLGESAGDMKVLSSDAIERGLETLKHFAAEAQSHDAYIRAVATSAVREATNREEFIEQARSLAGVDVEVVSGIEEGRLIYVGAIHALPLFATKALVIDIGGGSTETVFGFEGQALSVNSAKVGHIRMSQRYFPDGMGTAESVEECRQAIRGIWTPMFQERLETGFDQIVGCSGTIAAIASMTLARHGKRLPESINGMRFQAEDLLETINEVIQARVGKKRKPLAGLESKRSDVILAGSIILEQALIGLRASELTISSYALREGIVFDTVQHTQDSKTYHQLAHLRYQSVEHMLDQYQVRRIHAEHVKNLSLQLYDALQEMHGYTDKERELLEAASLLHDVGYHIASDQHHKHSEYIIRNSAMLGFTNDESEIIASIARYHRKSHPKKKHVYYNSLTSSEQQIVAVLAAILRIAEGLDRRQQQTVRNVSALVLPNKIVISIWTDEGKADIELWGAERRKSLLEQVSGRNVQFQTVESTQPGNDYRVYES